ncbi:RNA-directed DNA polymerase [Paraburkholderia sediminicola]|uniref:antiviral reverse transcriptase Drt3b n=1 Tax=Paraburkholderia sediminicola TaxID=458836 RepID=UPI0038B8D523
MFKVRRNKVRIRKTDHFRALLTETLPYEVPLLFSNDGLYLAAKDGLIEKIKEEHGLDIFYKEATIPYKYKIKKNAYDSRGLAVMHPAQQIAVGAFYSKYDHLIVGLCQRSPFTLRAPAAIASYFVERVRMQKTNETKAAHVEQLAGGFESVPGIGTSYFSYRKYAFMFRFYDSTEFLVLEKKFKFLTNMDISDCFNRIYTHTIAWAVKSKKYAKNNKGPKTVAFENDFDRLIQNSNHGETAGILIGPEISRIFAEIMLQRVDLDILKKATAQGYTDEVHYTIRRYVDDYFVYSNKESVRDDLKKIISDCLSEYKLAINSSKTAEQSRPYITGASIARHNIASNIVDFFNKYRTIEVLKEETGAIASVAVILHPIGDIGAVVNQTIAAIKRSIGERGSYDATANYFFGIFKKLLLGLSGKSFKAAKGNPGDRLYFFISAVVDVVFFYYSMTPRVRQTYQISEIILMAVKIMKSAPMELRDSLIRKIVHEARLIILQANADQPEYKIEIMNLLIVLRGLGDKYILDQAFLFKLFGIESQDNKSLVFRHKFDYFQLVFLISYLGGVERFDHIVRSAVAVSVERFEDIDWEQNAESVFLFFDLLACPYVSQDEKLQIAKLVLRHKSSNDINARAAALITAVGVRPWFFAWNEQADLALVLKKKELRTPY